MLNLDLIERYNKIISFEISKQKLIKLPNFQKLKDQLQTMQ